MVRKHANLRSQLSVLTSLEFRAVPAGISLISRVEPTLMPESGGGWSELETIDNDSILMVRAPAMSADGRFTVFTSTAANLVSGQVDDNNVKDVFLHDAQTNLTALVSHSVAGATTAGSRVSYSPTISANGRFVSFLSSATDLVASFVNNNGSTADLFRFDRITGAVELISRAAGTTNEGCNNASGGALMSADGSILFYSSKATDLIAGFSNPGGSLTQAYSFEPITATTTLISHRADSPTAGALGNSNVSDMTPDGRYLVYSSIAYNLYDPPLTTSKVQICAFDRTTGMNSLVTWSAGNPSAGGDGHSGNSVISADGRFVAFSSYAGNLVPGFVDGNGANAGDVFLADRQDKTIRLVSRASPGSVKSGNGQSHYVSMSASGDRIAYRSLATDLEGIVSDVNGSGHDILLYDRLTDQNVLVSSAIVGAGITGNARSTDSVISDDGSTVLFNSTSTDLVAGFEDGNAADEEGYEDVFAYACDTALIELISHRANSLLASGNRYSEGTDISADGRFIAFHGVSTNIVPELTDTNGQRDVFRFDRLTGAATIFSNRQGGATQSAGGDFGDGNFGDLRFVGGVSDDGRFVTFLSAAANLIPGQIDENFAADVFVSDRWTGTTTLVSRAVGTTTKAANSVSSIPVISGDGRFIAYCSQASDLVAGFVDQNGNAGSSQGADVYLFDRLSGVNSLVSRSITGSAVGGNGASGTTALDEDFLVSISDNGQFVSYRSTATDLMLGFVDNNGPESAPGSVRHDLFLFDRLTGQNSLISHQPGSPLSGGAYQSDGAVISADGRYVAFFSGPDLVPGQHKVHQVYCFDRESGVVSLVSHVLNQPNQGGNGISLRPVISADGNYVAFTSQSTDLVSNGATSSQYQHAYLWNRLTNEIEMVSHRFDSLVQGSSTSAAFLSISGDGRFVAYEAVDGGILDNFVPMSTKMNVYLYDRDTNLNFLGSHSIAGNLIGANAEVRGSTISNDGRFVGFTTSASNVSEPLNEYPSMSSTIDSFVYDRLTGEVAQLTLAANDDDRPGNAHSAIAVFARRSNVAVLSSYADNLVAGDFNGFPDVFVYSFSPTVEEVSIYDGSPQRSTIRSMTLTFDQPITFAGEPAAAFELAVGGVQLAVNTGSLPTSSVTITFTGPGTQFGSLPDGDYTLRVLAAQIVGAGPLDGNNDGIAGDDYLFSFHRLFGDADGDRDVDVNDFAAFRMSFGGISTIFDFDNDGDVDTSDFGQFRARFGVIV